MAKIVTSIKKIASLGKRELRYTEMDGEKKFDIRVWNGDKYEDGVRFSQEEMEQLYKGVEAGKFPFDIGSKQCILNGGEYALSVLFNGRTYIRPFVTKGEMEALLGILDVAMDNLLEYDPNASKEPDPEPEEEEEKEKDKDKAKKTYANAYEKFKAQFEAYRNDQPENRRKGYELTHNIVLEHIKDIIATSDEYNKNAMQDWKTSGNMMRYCQDKMFENAEAVMNVSSREEANEMLYQFVDEYIGDTSDKPKPQPKKTKTKSHTVKKDEVKLPKELEKKLLAKG